MKLTKKQNELINSGITLTEPEVASVEEFIQKKAKTIKPQHLTHHLCMLSSRGYSSSSTYADRFRDEFTGM